MVYTMKHTCSIMCWAWHEHDQPRDTRFYILAIAADRPHLTILRSFAMNRGKVGITEDIGNIQDLSTTIKV